jgi:hypothetical protein
MALTPEQIDLLADKYIIGLFQELEQDIIADIARRVRATGRLTETAELMAKSMVEQGYSANKIRADVMRAMRADKALQDEIAINTKEYKQFITDEIKATVCKAKLVGNKLVADAGMMAYNNDLSMWKKAGQSLSKPNSLSQIMDAFRKQTADELRNLTKTTGFKGTVLQPVMSAYQREMDMALVKLATGTFSYDQICNDVVHNLAQSGLRTIDYASGRSYQLDTAARMSVRTGMSQLSGRITEANIESTGVDLVITSQHMGSRPEHAEWQNKVFCYKGKTKKYPNFEESTGYGTVTGLKGANCSHDFYPYWEGISVKVPDVKEPAPVMVDGKEYDYYSATQKQRQMERNIRATKREIEAQKAIGGDTSILQANLRKQSADYHKFSTDVGIRAKNNRLKVVSGSSDLSKIKVAKHSGNGTIKPNKEKAVFDSKKYTESIKTEEQKIYKDKTETAVLFDKHGNVLFRESSNATNYVQFSDAQLEMMKNATLSHNHPSNSTFSSEDVGLFTGRGLNVIRAAGEKRTYQLKNVGKVDFDNNFASDYKFAMQENKKITDEKYCVIEKEHNDGVIGYSEYNKKLNNLNVELNNLNSEWLKKNSKQYGYKYSVTERR